MADKTSVGNLILRLWPNNMAARQEALHAKKLEQALRSHERFPINLEWMVDVFKYKHISSLTTHLKRHFKMNVHYKRFAQEQNKRVWTYFISVECFIGICEYVRHAARKKIANVWLRKVGIKGSSRRTPRDYEEDIASFSEEDYIDDEEEQGEVEGDGEGEEYDYYEEQSPAKRRRLEEDEEYQCEEEDEDHEEQAYFKQMEEEEACAGYDTDESADYESSSSREDSSPSLRNSASLTISSNSLRPFNPQQTTMPQFRIVSSSSSDSLASSCDSVSSSGSSAPSTPTSPIAERMFLAANSNCLPVIPQNVASPRVQNVPVAVPKPQVSAGEVPPSAPEMSKEQVDWSYLHLRPSPHPLGNSVGIYDFPAKYFASLMFPQQYFANYPQAQPYSYVISPNMFFSNCHALHFPNLVVDPSSYGVRATHNTDNLHCDLPNMDDRQFDTNVFLSFPDEHHFQYPMTHNS